MSAQQDSVGCPNCLQLSQNLLAFGLPNRGLGGPERKSPTVGGLQPEFSRTRNTTSDKSSDFEAAADVASGLRAAAATIADSCTGTSSTASEKRTWFSSSSSGHSLLGLYALPERLCLKRSRATLPARKSRLGPGVSVSSS
jgi:hypothetical protein